LARTTISLLSTTSDTYLPQVAVLQSFKLGEGERRRPGFGGRELTAPNSHLRSSESVRGACVWHALRCIALAGGRNEVTMKGL